MFKYNYVFCGDFLRTKLVDGNLCEDHDYYNFQIDVPIPIYYDTKDEAKRCPCSLKFEVEDGHVVLRIYSNWEQGVNKNGNWYEHVSGNIIDTIKWEEYWKYKMIRSKVTSKDMRLYVDATMDYVPDATPWDELFDIDKQPQGWCNTVESLAYSIDILDAEETNNE